MKIYTHTKSRLFPGIKCMEINQFGYIRFFNELDQLHNDEDKPAFIIPSQNMLAYYQYGLLHRTTGPASIWGECEEYYILGIHYSKMDYDYHIKKFLFTKKP